MDDFLIFYGVVKSFWYRYSLSPSCLGFLQVTARLNEMNMPATLDRIRRTNSNGAKTIKGISKLLLDRGYIIEREYKSGFGNRVNTGYHLTTAGEALLKEFCDCTLKRVDKVSYLYRSAVK